MQMTALDQWYDYAKSHEPGALRNLLHPDAVFESPVVHSPQRGREITFKYLTAALARPGRLRRKDSLTSQKVVDQREQAFPTPRQSAPRQDGRD